MPEANVAKQRMSFGRMPMANVFDDLATQFQLLGRNYEIGITK